MSECDRGSVFSVDVRPSTAPNMGAVELRPGHNTEDLGRDPCSAAQQVISVPQGQKTILGLYFVDANGAPVDFSGVTGATSRFIVKERLNNVTKEVNLTGHTVSAAQGKIKIVIPYNTIDEAGIYHAQILLYNVDDELLWTTNYWLAVEMSLDADAALIGQEPISIPEVRMMLRDVCADENLLLGALEFSDSAIAYAMRWPIHEFNETNQPKTTYTGKNFPWHLHWLKATCGYLLNTAARKYARDSLPYSAGGVSINDKAKSDEYRRLAKDLLDAWHSFVFNQKIELNVAGAFGTLRSTYSGSY